MPKAFLLTNKRYDLYNLNIPKLWRKEEEEEENCENGNGNGKWIGHGQRVPDCRKRVRWTTAEVRGHGDDEVKVPIWNGGPASVFNHNYRNMDVDEEEPVNLSIKKIDLFNLTQLAEVRRATALHLIKNFLCS